MSAFFSARLQEFASESQACELLTHPLPLLPLWLWWLPIADCVLLYANARQVIINVSGPQQNYENNRVLMIKNIQVQSDFREARRFATNWTSKVLKPVGKNSNPALSVGEKCF